MAYDKTIWQNWVTDLNENNMQKIEDELELLGGKTVTTANEDVNNYTKEGVYYFGSSHTPNNIPSGVNGWLAVIVTGVWTKQFWFRHGSLAGKNDYETYTRTRFSNDSNDWSPWRRFVVEDEIYYKSGESIVLSQIILNGDFTNGSRTARLVLPTFKSLKNISNFNVSSLVGAIRGVNGYMDSDYQGNTNFLTSDYSVSAYKKSDSTLEIFIEKQNGTFNNSTNNTPISGDVSLQINLS